MNADVSRDHVVDGKTKEEEGKLVPRVLNASLCCTIDELPLLQEILEMRRPRSDVEISGNHDASRQSGCPGGLPARSGWPYLVDYGYLLPVLPGRLWAGHIDRGVPVTVWGYCVDSV